MRVIVLIASAVAVMGVGVFVFSDSVNDMMFNEDEFARCFRNEVVGGVQGDAALQGDGLIMMSADQILGASLERLAHTVANGINRDGMLVALNDARDRSMNETSRRLTEHEKSGALPKKEMEGHIADATAACIERQQRL